MSTDPSAHLPSAALDDPACASRHLMRWALKGALATLDRHLAHPYASLVLLATDPTGAPTFLISRLAQHTRNLEQDARASLLLDGTDGLADPLTGGRLTLTGTAVPCPDPAAPAPLLGPPPPGPGLCQFGVFRSLRAQGPPGTLRRWLWAHRRPPRRLAPDADRRCRRPARRRTRDHRPYERRSCRC